MILKKHYLSYKVNKQYRNHLIKSGSIGFSILSANRVSRKKENLLKLIILRKLKEFSSKKFKIWFFSNCLFNLTELPLESRMGKGKGEVRDSFAFYKKGLVLFEIKGLSFFESSELTKSLNDHNILKFKLIY